MAAATPILNSSGEIDNGVDRTSISDSSFIVWDEDQEHPGERGARGLFPSWRDDSKSANFLLGEVEVSPLC